MKHSAETIHSALERVRSGERTLLVARDLKISTTAINRWRKYLDKSLEQIKTSIAAGLKDQTGARRERVIVIPGQKFGKLTAVESKGKKGAEVQWLFKCDCGNEVVAGKTRVTRGERRSCGCERRKALREFRFGTVKR